MKKLLFFIVFAIFTNCKCYSQQFLATMPGYNSGVKSCYDYNWELRYPSGDWVYGVWRGHDISEFCFRFNYTELGLHELKGAEWKTVKKFDKILFGLSCTFEYYVTDDYPTLEDAIKQKPYPCARWYYFDKERPIVLRKAKARVSVEYDDNDEIRSICFNIDSVQFCITVWWDYSGNKMSYRY